MGYTNETTHYGIPLPLGSDKTTPMDYNTSAQEVDTVLFEAKTDSASALQKANQLQQDLSTTNDNVTGVTGRVTTLEGTVTTQGGAILQNTQDIADVRADALDMIEAKDEGTAQVATVAVTSGEYFRYNDVLYIATQNIAVGDTIVPNTNCRATNIGTELMKLPRHTILGEVVADGTKTRAQLLSELTAQVDFTKLRIGVSILDAEDGKYAYTFDQLIPSNNTVYFGLANNVIRQITLQKNGVPSDTYYILGTSTTPQDGSSGVPTAGTTFKVFA